MTARIRDAQIVQKMIRYCDEIDETIAIFGDSLEQMKKTSPYKNAVSMCIFQIGELVTHLSEPFKEKYNHMPWKQIKGMRNIVAHGYQKLDIDE